MMPEESVDGASVQKAAQAFQPVRLREAFADPRSKQHGTFMFLDQIGSTRAKTTSSEAAWVNELAFTYDTVVGCVAKRCTAAKIKYVGDGMLISFDGDDYALDAIMIAIAVQEAIEDANRSTFDGGLGAVTLELSIGIASGTAYRFRDPNGVQDHLGLVVDRAARLCDAASAKAIFIDRATYAATNFLRVQSRVGEVFNRTPEEYAGAMQTAVLKGMPAPVDYHEILWSKTLFGVPSQLLTDSTTNRATTVGSATPQPVAQSPRPAKRAEKLVGRVKCWLADRGFGFIVTATGEEFYFSPNLMVYPDDTDKLKEGTEVAFVAIESYSTGQSRRAAAVLVAGQLADGPLVVVPTDLKPYGWIEVRDQSGHGQLVHMSADSTTKGFTRNQVLSFRLEITERGAHAADVAAVEEDDAA
jgi:class 3 adenylate cyclase/cold shock CspA family protein